MPEAGQDTRLLENRTFWMHSVLVYGNRSVPGVQQMMGLLAQRLAEELLVALDDGRVLMAAAHLRLLVVGI